LPGRLVLCPTPIGNLEDITLRALRILKEADVVLCEDTRRTNVLLRHYGIDRALVSYHRWNEREREALVLDHLRAGHVVALCSDAGSPGLSDPGQRIVEAAVRDGQVVEALPGAQALIPALTVSGLPTEPFHFEGFLPKTEGACRRRLRELALADATLVFYESPRRVRRLLVWLREELGERRAALARELTKVHEEVRRGTLSELAASLPEDLRGECVLVVEGRTAALPLEDAESFVATLRSEGLEPRRILAEGLALGYRRSELYDMLFRAPADRSGH
jgi:16S rRNA (cytidine1402-2'-O)-methyltransferase